MDPGSFSPFIGDDLGSLDMLFDDQVVPELLLTDSPAPVLPQTPLPEETNKTIPVNESSQSSKNQRPVRKRKSPMKSSNFVEVNEKMSKRERNRMHAKNSRERKKLLLESLQQGMQALQEENDILREALEVAKPGAVEELKRKNLISNAKLTKRVTGAPRIKSNSSIEEKNSSQNLCAGDFMFMEALECSKQSFVITDPKLPDNPIVFASENFYRLTGYDKSEVLGRNCRFLQGPETNTETVNEIRDAVADRREVECILKNYRKDGSSFYNKLYVSPLLSADGSILNFMAVQTELSPEMVERYQKLTENKT